jgi:hypothetical protein
MLIPMYITGMSAFCSLYMKLFIHSTLAKTQRLNIRIYSDRKNNHFYSNVYIKLKSIAMEEQCYLHKCTGLFETIVWVLTNCHTQYTWDRSICIFLFLSTWLREGSGLNSSSSRKYPGTEGTNQNRHWNHHRWHATNSFERSRLSCWCL